MQTVLQPPYNAAQVEILKLFSQGLTEEQLDELRRTLVAFRFKLLNEHVEDVAKRKKLTKKDIDAASKAHQRTAYKSKKAALELKKMASS